MCGIAGVVDRHNRGLGNVLDLATTLRFRGPDSVGVYEGKGAAIAQTRLAIIDLVTGDPPIANEDGSIGVAFNGEIYNFLRLRDELVANGHQLKTRCDTEVIAHLAEDHEPVALARRLDGMFAFAVWDDRRHRLILGRDRFGKKPLYYWTNGQRFVFGSELKAVLADEYVPRDLDPLAIPAYLTFGYVPTPHTFFEGIRSLPPGHVLTFDETGTITIERYWRAPTPGIEGCSTLRMSFSSAQDEVLRLLGEAVKRRMIADVPLGAFLSGGTDSSSVVAMMSRFSAGPVSTFTIGFDDRDGFDERPYAAEVARHFGTNHTEFVVEANKAELIERLVMHHDQPFGDSSALPTYLLSELTKQHVTVALCGDGGDELFAGYERFAAALTLKRFDRVPAPARRAIIAALGRVPPNALGGRIGSAQRMMTCSGQDAPDAYLSWLSYVPQVWRRRLLDNPSEWATDEYRAIWHSTEGAHHLDRLINLNLQTYLLDDLLPKVDRMAMAHGLEVRSPFLDTELAEFALRLRPSTKIAGLSLKRVLKSAVRDLLPRDILRRPKRGFGIPLDRWFRDDLYSYVDGMLLGKSSHIGHHLNTHQVRAILAQHQSGDANLGHALWTLLTLEIFLRREGW